MNVELVEISKRFGAVQANQNVSIRIDAGSIHGLLGENGAGKSTLVKILSGFVRRDQGQIRLDDQSVEIRSPAQAIQLGIGMLHQDPLDFPPLSVLDNFMVGQTRGIWLDQHQAAEELHHLATTFEFHLDPYAQGSQLTVGERQQLEILRLLALGVKTLILDEPTTGISSSQKEALFAALRHLADQGRSILFVSHKLEDVAELCDQATVMRQGQVAGSVRIPCPTQALIELMFGRELAQPSKPDTRTQAIALSLESIEITDGRIQVSLPDLSIAAGEVIGLAGLEGNGQHLLLLLCSGLLQPIRGRITVGSTDMTQQPYSNYFHQGIAYFPADRLREGLVHGLTIQEHMALRHPNPGLIVNWQQALASARSAIDHFKIRGNPFSYVERLSGGNQQRTQLALLPQSLQILLMEHPTRGLDVESALWVWQQLIERCRTGTVILFASSDLDEIMQYSDRVMVFSGGQASEPIEVADLTVDQLGRLIGGQFSS